MGKWIEQAIHLRSKSGQQIHEEMFDIPGHQGNENQNYIEISSHHSQDDCHQEFKQQILTRIWRKRKSYILLVVM
jgi:hypothetical protein